MSSKHTQGPWNVKPLGVITGGPLVQYVRGSSQPQIGMATLPANAAPDEDPAEVQMANAHLMGAALDLLEALKRARAEIGYFRRHAPNALPVGHELLAQDTLQMIDAAIAKATEAA